MRSSLTTSSDTPGPLLLIQPFTSTVSTPHSVVALCESCLTLIPSPLEAGGYTGCPKDQRCIFFSCPEPLYQKAESKDISKEEREGGCEWSTRGFKRELNSPAIKCTSFPKEAFNRGNSNRFVYPHRSRIDFILLHLCR